MKFPNNFTPLEIFLEYLKKVLVSSKKVEEYEVQLVFLLALKDFFEDNINIETLSVIANQLYYELNKPQYIDSHYERNLAKVLSDTTDISYYFKHQDENPSNKKFCEELLENLRKYYQKNKHLLEKLTSTNNND